YITQPNTRTIALEGRPVTLVGAAADLQDGRVADGSLTWLSSRDGGLGTGERLSSILSVGVHTLTLSAVNSAGLYAATSMTLTVLGDYDSDGLSDARELGPGLNPLTDSDAQSDADGDGLPLVMELLRHTNQNLADTDGDGANDADEIAAGSDPRNAADKPSTLPPNTLKVSPAALTLTVDLALDNVLPQHPVIVYSQLPLSWTLSANVGWVAASKTAGRTLDTVTILLDVFEMNDGVSSGLLTFTNPANGQQALVPITVNVINKSAYCDVNSDGQTDATDLLQVGKAAGATRGGPGYARRLDLDRNEVIDSTDYDLAQNCVFHRAMLPIVQRP
ncbi:MAG: dockerin type I domain-containing protein, partial [Thermoflexales bacterium]